MTTTDTKKWLSLTQVALLAIAIAQCKEKVKSDSRNYLSGCIIHRLAKLVGISDDTLRSWGTQNIGGVEDRGLLKHTPLEDYPLDLLWELQKEWDWGPKNEASKGTMLNLVYEFSVPEVTLSTLEKRGFNGPLYKTAVKAHKENPTGTTEDLMGMTHPVLWMSEAEQEYDARFGDKLLDAIHTELGV